MTASVHVTQFLNTFFFHTMRNAFWKWGEDEGGKKVPTALIYGTSFVSLTKCYTPNAVGWEPHPELTEEVIEPVCSTGKQERETRIWLKAEVNSCSRRPSAVLN